MNKGNRGTIDFCENRLKGILLYLWELYIYGESKIGSWCHSVNHFHIMWSIFTSIQIFSLIHYYHLSTTPAPILSWAYFITPAILLNRSDSVAVLWLAATLARINKRKWSLKKEKIKQNLMQLQKTSAWRNLIKFKASLLWANHFFHTRKHFWHSNLNEPQRKNFVLIIIQLSEVGIQPSSELFENSNA